MGKETIITVFPHILLILADFYLITMIFPVCRKSPALNVK